VLDPNNDLARLGDAWPHPPAGWGEGDPEKAEDFLKHTDVVVWTPRWEGGRPLSFQPLPDFKGVLGDIDEFNSAIDAAVASLAPRAKVDGSTAKADRGRAVLTEALRHFAKQGRSGLRFFLAELADLADGVSALEDAPKIAYEMSQNLTAAMVNDPLFGGGGTPIDPGELLRPAAGKRARISVISFIGLPSDDQRQSFVNQLQMALFAWVKRNPAGDEPLGGLLVMDEAQTLAPSGAMTACTQSTLALASQARKYGLGLVFATQAPKALHNRIPGNAATQFFGLLNSPVQIEAAKEMARAKSGDVSDISRLGTGQFYASGEGFSFRKVQTPLCLSYHPKSPLTTEEVAQRAREGLALQAGGVDALDEHALEGDEEGEDRQE
jgi:DNA helicase HerA-like ATPase